MYHIGKELVEPVVEAVFARCRFDRLLYDSAGMVFDFFNIFCYESLPMKRPGNRAYSVGMIEILKLGDSV